MLNIRECFLFLRVYFRQTPLLEVAMTGTVGDEFIMVVLILRGDL